MSYSSELRMGKQADDTDEEVLHDVDLGKRKLVGHTDEENVLEDVQAQLCSSGPLPRHHACSVP
jgi:hypothetical protein